jgi:hypothetical protein
MREERFWRGHLALSPYSLVPLQFSVKRRHRNAEARAHRSVTLTAERRLIATRSILLPDAAERQPLEGAIALEGGESQVVLEHGAVEHRYRATECS